MLLAYRCAVHGARILIIEIKSIVDPHHSNTVFVCSSSKTPPLQHLAPAGNYMAFRAIMLFNNEQQQSN